MLLLDKLEDGDPTEDNWLYRIIRREGPHRMDSIVSVVYVTAAPTFTGPVGGYSTQTSDLTTANVGAPLSQSSDGDTTTIAEPTQLTLSTPTSSPTTTSTDSSSSSTSGTSTSQQTDAVASSTPGFVTSAVPATTSDPVGRTSTPVAETTAADSSSISAIDSAGAASSGSMSAGGRAGLVIGVLLLVGLVAVAALFWLHHRRQKRERQSLGDSEKQSPADPMPMIERPPAAQLSMKPMPPVPPPVDPQPATQIVPDLNIREPNPDGALAMAGSGAVGDQSSELPRSDSAHGPVQPVSGSVEGDQNPFQDPANPFDNQVASSPPLPPPKDTPIAEPGPNEIQPATVVSEHAVATDAAVVAAAAVGAAAGVTTGMASTLEPNQPGTPDSIEPRLASPGPSECIPISDDPASAAPILPAASAPLVTAGATAAPATPSNVHRVQMDFNPTMADELELRAGQLVRLLREYDDGWARCVRLGDSREGVVPRTCLSAHSVKPRVPGPMPDRKGSPQMELNGRGMSQTGGSLSPTLMGGPPRFYADDRPMSSTGPFPIPPRPQPAHSMSPGSSRRPEIPRPLTPGQGYRPFPQQRSMSPGPYGASGMPRPSIPGASKKRSNSFGGVAVKPGPVNTLSNPSPLGEIRSPPESIGRTPVPGQIPKAE